MKAILLNPPGRRRGHSRRRNYSATLEAYGAHQAAMLSGASAAASSSAKTKSKRRRHKKAKLGRRPKVGAGCRIKMSRYKAWKKRHARVLGGRKGARKRKAAKRATFMAGIGDYFSGKASNPRGRRRGRSRNDGGSTWIPAFGGGGNGEHDGGSEYNPRGGRGRGRKRNSTFNYGTQFTRKANDGGSQWLPAYKNPYWVPRYAQNPGNIVGSLTKGFQPQVLLSTLPYIGGALGNAFASNFIKKFMPDMLKTGIGGSAIDIASAGLLGASVGLIAPRYAGQVFFGGVIDTVLTLANQYIKPLLGMRGMGCMNGDCGGGMADYLTPQNAASAMPLGYFGDYLTPQNAQQALPLGGFGDYATTADVAAAQPLGQFYDLQAEEYEADIV